MVIEGPSGSIEPVPVAKWHNRPAGRLAIGGLLLLAEYLAVSLAFDAQSVRARGGIWTILGLAGNIGPLLVVGATAFLLVPRLPKTSAARNDSVGRANVWMLLLHALLAMAFAYVTTCAFGSKQAPPGPAVLWLLTWSWLKSELQSGTVWKDIAEWPGLALR